MYTVKYQNLSGDWFKTNCPDVSSAFVVFEWKKTGGVCQRAEMWKDEQIVDTWEKE